MSHGHTAFVGSIPENYDKYLGPIFFDNYASDLVARLPDSGLTAVLEVACGTGIVTRRLRDSLPLNVRLVATDLNQAMIDWARGKFRQDEAVEWRQADATNLPFQNESFDLVVCQFGLMFFSDKKAGIEEACRVLVPGGTYLFNVWDAIEHNEIALIAHNTIKRFFDVDPPRFYEIPFGFHDADVIEGMLTEAGFKEVESAVINQTGTSPRAIDAAVGLIEGNPVAGQIVERNPSYLPKVIDAVASAIVSRYGEGPLEFKSQALVWRAVR